MEKVNVAMTPGNFLAMKKEIEEKKKKKKKVIEIANNLMKDINDRLKEGVNWVQYGAFEWSEDTSAVIEETKKRCIEAGWGVVIEGHGRASHFILVAKKG